MGLWALIHCLCCLCYGSELFVSTISACFTTASRCYFFLHCRPLCCWHPLPNYFLHFFYFRNHGCSFHLLHSTAATSATTAVASAFSTAATSATRAVASAFSSAATSATRAVASAFPTAATSSTTAVTSATTVVPSAFPIAASDVKTMHSVMLTMFVSSKSTRYVFLLSVVEASNSRKIHALVR